MAAEPNSHDQDAVRYRISNEADATRAVVAANQHGLQAGLDPVDAQCVSTAVSELARNILKYAGSGQLLIREVASQGSRGVVVTARDNGPGIADVEAAMADHFSSGGTLGLGLPGVRRMMHDFHLESVPGQYTSVSCIKWNKPPRGGSRHFLATDCTTPEAACNALALNHSSFGRPCPGEYVSGDLALVEARGQHTMLAVIDGLGHGPEAHAVSQRAQQFLVAHWTTDVVATLSRLHESLRGSIGAVAGLAVIDRQSGKVDYAGVGNTSYRLFGSRSLRLVSAAGNLGYQMRTPQLQSHVLGENDVVVMYTDGVKDRFDLEDYPQLVHQRPETVAQNVVERFGKSHDDATCLVVRRAS